MRSLRTQLSLAILFVLLVMVSFVTMLANHVVNRQFEHYHAIQEQKRRETIASDLSEQYQPLLGGWHTDYLHVLGMYSLQDGYLVTVYDVSGNTVWDAEHHDMDLCRKIMNDISIRMDGQDTGGGFTTTTYDLVQGGQAVGHLSIKSYGPYFYQETDFQFIHALNVLLPVMGLVSCLFSVVTGAFLAHRITRPITKTAEIAKQIAGGNYRTRFEGGTRTKELGMLVSSINDLAGALDKQESYRVQLTADIAHELRTPLTTVRAHLEAMVEGLWDATPQRLRSCLDEVSRLGGLVADLDRLASLESGSLKLNLAPADLFELAQSAAASFEKEAHQKGVTINVEGSRPTVPADRDRLFQVMANLLSNAVKYTQENGHITVTVADRDENGIISIADDGMGMAAEDLPHIFERFYRTDQSRSRKTGGAGIGLTIVKSIVEAHGGKIEVESSLGAGSCFTMILPKNK